MRLVHVLNLYCLNDSSSKQTGAKEIQQTSMYQQSLRKVASTTTLIAVLEPCYRKYHNAFQKTAARINLAIAEAITRWQVLDPPLLQYFVNELYHTHPIISRICKRGGYRIDSCVRSFNS
ncbi:hypothetical protein TNIN_391331 [Trichonephila inaurata madagascariensis]|uniref:Uncharacterized protein n=1 Tax=Trichonephila inaurata madagascariensis TaxID=2747483 RepID=A0A8X6XPP2_9ARAC|nr:hypothetical protein TNIN_391331 [Trichonephila inaurata madagascariensis]